MMKTPRYLSVYIALPEPMLMPWPKNVPPAQWVTSKIQADRDNASSVLLVDIPEVTVRRP